MKEVNLNQITPSFKFITGSVVSMRPPNMKLYCHDPGVRHLSLKRLVIWSERGNMISGLFQEAYKQPKAREAFCASVFAGRG